MMSLHESISKVWTSARPLHGSRMLRRRGRRGMIGVLRCAQATRAPCIALAKGSDWLVFIAGSSAQHPPGRGCLRQGSE